VGWLRRNRVLLPGVSVLAKQVASVRQVAEKRLYATVAGAARRADASLPADLVALLGVPEGRRVSELERLRRPPTQPSGTGLTVAGVGHLRRQPPAVGHPVGHESMPSPVAPGALSLVGDDAAVRQASAGTEMPRAR
jgi:hypothetical protein